jgi:hypothetical protein
MKYGVKRYFSSFVTFEIEAVSDEDAYDKSQKIQIDTTELINNLQEWEDADEIIELEENS